MTTECCPRAIEVRGAEKSFINASSNKSFQVFSNLSITVPAGKIYGLLGPSGSGKTTLLRCIVGREKLDRGRVVIFGRPVGTKQCGVPGRNVGYMPQDTCIFDTMTIEECFNYYGSILGLSDEKIRSRVKYYAKFLKLPSIRTITTKLSGGQGRRVSFAIALFHHPKLIILDEPTVGIDPIIKSYMWKHLLELAKTKCISIILTTHYIEEARQSNVVGLLQDGRIAAEDSPENMISNFNCNSLEEAFLRITSSDQCIRPIEEFKGQGKANQDPESRVEEGWITRDLEEDSQQVVRKAPLWNSSDFTIRWQPLKSVVVKYILFLTRFPGGLLFLLTIPSGIIVVFILTMRGHVKNIDVITVNEDRGDMGRGFLKNLDQNYLAHSNCSSLPDAMEALRDGNTYGVLHIGQNFSEMLSKRFENGPFANEEVLQQSKIGLTVTNINFHITMYVTYRVYLSMQRFLYSFTNISIGDSPILFNKELYNSLESPSMLSITQPIVLCAMYYGAAASTVMILFVEMSKGYLERSFVAGTTIAEVLSGLMIVEFMVAGTEALLGIGVLIPALEGVSLTSWLLLFLLLYATTASGTAYGLFVSLVFPNTNQLIMVAATSAIISGAITGAFWPLEAMPLYVQYFCKCTPLVYPIRAFKIIMSNSWHMFYGEVILGFTVLFVWCLLCVLVSFRYLHMLK